MTSPSGLVIYPSSCAARGAGFEDLLDAVDVRGEGGDDDASLVVVEDAVEGRGQRAFARRIAGAFGVRGVAQQQPDPLLAEFGEATQVDRRRADGGEVDLEVPGVDDAPAGGRNAERDRVGHGMVDVNEFDVECAERDDLARADLVQVVGADVVLVELAVEDPERQAGAVHVALDLFEQVGDRADVVLVPVGQDQTAQLLRVALEVGEVRRDDVDAGHILLREGDAAVDDDDVVPVLERGDVHADAVDAAERNDPDGGVRGGRAPNAVSATCGRDGGPGFAGGSGFAVPAIGGRRVLGGRRLGGRCFPGLRVFFLRGIPVDFLSHSTPLLCLDFGFIFSRGRFAFAVRNECSGVGGPTA